MALVNFYTIRYNNIAVPDSRCDAQMGESPYRCVIEESPNTSRPRGAQVSQGRAER
jgi:hypothetical protein